MTKILRRNRLSKHATTVCDVQRTLETASSSVHEAPLILGSSTGRHSLAQSLADDSKKRTGSGKRRGGEGQFPRGPIPIGDLCVVAGRVGDTHTAAEPKAANADAGTAPSRLVRFVVAVEVMSGVARDRGIETDSRGTEELRWTDQVVRLYRDVASWNEIFVANIRDFPTRGASVSWFGGKMANVGKPAHRRARQLPASMLKRAIFLNVSSNVTEL